MPKLGDKIDEKDRFASKWRSDLFGCHIWTGALFPSGYGAFWGIRPGEYAHRVAWRLTHGDIPEQTHVLHKCDVRACVNIEHLFLGTALDNMRDMQAKGRAAPQHGTHNPLSRLTEEIVLAIRARAVFGVTQEELAREFGVRQSNISLIVNRRTWKHV